MNSCTTKAEGALLTPELILVLHNRIECDVIDDHLETSKSPSPVFTAVMSDPELSPQVYDQRILRPYREHRTGWVRAGLGGTNTFAALLVPLVPLSPYAPSSAELAPTVNINPHL